MSNKKETQNPEIQSKNSKKKKSKTLLIVVISIFMITLICVASSIAAYFYIKNKNKDTTNEQQEEESESDEEKEDDETEDGNFEYSEEGTVNYINIEISEISDVDKYSAHLTYDTFNMSFEYPKYWGEVEGYIYTGGYCYPTGSTYEIYFSDNEYIELVGATSDCDYQGGDVCPVYDGFTGTDDLKVDIYQEFDRDNYENFDPLAYNDRLHFGYQDLNIGESAISFYYAPSCICSHLGFRKNVVINTSLSKFTGMYIILDIVSPLNNTLASKGESAQTYYGLSNQYPDEETYKDYQQNYYDTYLYLIDQIKDSIENNSMDYLMKNQIEEFDEFIESIEFGS